MMIFKKIIRIYGVRNYILFYFNFSGTAYSWGMGTNYQLGNGTDEDIYEPTLVSGGKIKDKKIIKVSSGGQHTVFLTLNNS